MTNERGLEQQVINPNSPESIKAFEEKSHEQQERKHEVEETLDRLDAEGKNEATVRMIREALADGELNQVPRVEVEESGMEVAA